MVSLSHGVSLSKELWHKSIFLTGKDYGMISSKKRLERRLCMRANRRVMMRRTLLLQVMQGRENGRPSRILGRRTSLRWKEERHEQVKCFACHKSSHYAGQCLNKKKGKKEEVATSVDTWVSEFAAKFE